MKKQKCDYIYVVVESVLNADSQGRKRVLIRPIKGQEFDSSLNVECSKTLIANYPVGSRFRIRAKLTDMKGAPFLYSYFGWPFEVLALKK